MYPYAEHPTTDIICLAWAFDDEEPELWTPGKHTPRCEETGDLGCTCGADALPAEVHLHIINGGELRAWNAQFERVMWNEIMVKRYGAPKPELEQWMCSAAEAAAMALPRSLGQAAATLGIEQQKDDGGHRLMLQMCKPRRIDPDGTIVWWGDDPKDKLKLVRLYSYCKQDVRTECAVVKRLRRLTPREVQIYHLDQRVNDRGVKLDRPLVLSAQQIAQQATEQANLAMREITGGNVKSVTNHADLTNWLREQGVATGGVSKAAIRELLGQELEAKVRDALEIRADAGRTSIAKLQSLLDASTTDDRLKGMLLYHGAGTGRWSGRGPQPHNFPRGEVEDIESYIPATLAMQYEMIDLVQHPIVVVSSMLRSMLTAGEGNELIAADYSAIEARVLNWVAGQEDVLKLFRDGVDVYKYNAMRLYKIPLEEVKKFPHRQTGKFQELGCGFQMGAGKAVSAAKSVYGLELTDDEAKNIVDNYRETHDKVKQYWGDAQQAVKNAIEQPGVKFRFGAVPVTAIVIGPYLLLILPSGRALHYAAPKIEEAIMPWGDMGEQITFSGVNGYTRRWERMKLYGGLITENIVQAIARDLMAEGMLRAEAKGYLPVLSVHDEVVTEVPAGFGSVQELEEILCELPSWASGCPVAAEGWRGFRYRK